MSKNVDAIVDDILRAEGGYSNDRTDPGNWLKVGGQSVLIGTNWGVAAPTLRDWLGRAPTVQEMKSLSVDTAREIFKTKYYYQPNIDRLPGELQANVFDMSVNAGQQTAIKILQRLLYKLNIDPRGVDGRIGNGTIGASNIACEKYDMRRKYSDARIEYYEAIVARKPAMKKYIRGWTNRANSFATI